MTDDADDAKSFVIAWSLSIALGLFGADRLYLGYRRLAALKFLTLGGLGIWAFIDVVEMLSDRLPDARGNLLEGYPENRFSAIAFTAILWGTVLATLGVTGWLTGARL